MRTGGICSVTSHVSIRNQNLKKLPENEPRRNASHSLPLFDWADRRMVVPLNLAERVIAHRYGLSPVWARLVCRENGLGGLCNE